MRILSRPAIIAALLVVGTGALLAVVVFQPTQAGRTPTKGIPERVLKDLGPEIVDIVSGATRVETFRVKSVDREKKADGDAKTQLQGKGDDERWAIIATGPEQGPEFAGKLKSLLFDEATRVPSRLGAYNAELAFRLWNGKQSVTVVFGFEGSTFLMFAEDAAGKPGKSIEGGLLYNNAGKFDTGDLVARVKALAVEAFPKDKAIQELPNIAAMLEKGEPFELLSLHPDHVGRMKDKPKPADVFHGYQILGRTTIKDPADRKELVDGFKQSVEESIEAAAGCFNPRHGLRITQDGQTAEFVICFECIAAHVYVGDKMVRHYSISGDANSTYNDILKKYNVRLPPKAH